MGQVLPFRMKVSAKIPKLRVIHNVQYFLSPQSDPNLNYKIKTWFEANS